MNRHDTNDRISKALHSVDEDVSTEFLFGLTEEEFLYAAHKVRGETSDPVTHAMVLGAVLARNKILKIEATPETAAASNSAQG